MTDAEQAVAEPTAEPAAPEPEKPRRGRPAGSVRRESVGALRGLIPVPTRIMVETEAMQVIAAALLVLDDEARARVLHWAAECHKESSPRAGGEGAS